MSPRGEGRGVVVGGRFEERGKLVTYPFKREMVSD